MKKKRYPKKLTTKNNSEIVHGVPLSKMSDSVEDDYGVPMSKSGIDFSLEEDFGVPMSKSGIDFSLERDYGVPMSKSVMVPGKEKKEGDCSMM